MVFVPTRKERDVVLVARWKKKIQDTNLDFLPNLCESGFSKNLLAVVFSHKRGNDTFPGRRDDTQRKETRKET